MTHNVPREKHAAAGLALDPTVPNPARIWNYWVGGKDHFEADRALAEQFGQVVPNMPLIARLARQFLTGTVRQLAADGVRQFLDIGTGLPTADNTHEVAQRAAPESRIVYVDNDPVVLAHARALLTSSPEGATAYLDADLQDTETILEEAARTLDLTRPVGIMLLAILHYIPDLGEARRIVARLLAAVPAGSFLVISHAGTDLRPEEVAAFEERLNAHLPAERRHVARPRDLVASFFDGMELLEPGVVRVGDWRPDSPEESAAPTILWGGVGRKP